MANIIDFNLKLNKIKYPLLFQLKKKDQKIQIEKIFDIGYNIVYPEITNKNNDFHEINYKLSSLEDSLGKLIGLSNSSTKKGELAENILENIITQRYGDIIIKKTNHIPHSGDAWLYLPDNKIIMLESKNYTSTISKDEVNKMQNDMITNHIKWGLFVSFNANIQGMKDIDILIFTHNNENYHIILISNVVEDISKLDFGFTLIRKLINYYDDLGKFPWIVKNINNELNNLNEILQQNYLLRDTFNIMEKEIIKNLNLYYTKLRDYQITLNNKIKDIINKITSTMDNSINIINSNYDNFIQNSESKDKKLGIIATRIADIFQKKNIIININNELIFNDNKIGDIKIQTKKIILEFMDLTLAFNNNKDINQNLEILENIIL